MMRILILYGTTEGQTRKIATIIAQRLGQLSHETILVDSDHQPKALDPADYDAIIIAARVHASRYQRSIRRFVQRHRSALRQMPSAFVSVSMSAARHRAGDADRAAGYVERFIGRTGWQPSAIHHAAGARFYARKGRLGRWILALVDGHRYDCSRDHEFTDWSALGRFVDEWLEAAELASGVAA